MTALRRGIRDLVAEAERQVRALPVADPDNHHLFVSLGCAAENVSLAALAAGRPTEVSFAGTGSGKVEIALGRLPVTNCEAFDLDRSGIVTIDELSAGVASSLVACDVTSSRTPGTRRDGRCASRAPSSDSRPSGGASRGMDAACEPPRMGSRRVAGACAGCWPFTEPESLKCSP